MDEGLSLFIFALEVDRKPVIAWAEKKHATAEALIHDEHLRKRLATLRSGGAVVRRFLNFTAESRSARGKADLS